MFFGSLRVIQNSSAKTLINSALQSWTLPFTKSLYLRMRLGPVIRQQRSDVLTQKCVLPNACTCGNVLFILKEKRRWTDEIRWDEKAGLRRDAVRSQVIDVLEAQEIKETGNEED